MKLPVLLAVAAAILTSAELVNGQDKDPWIGKRVFTQFGAVLKVGNDVVDDQGRSRSLAVSGHDRSADSVYRVEHVNGEWLWLKDEKSSKAGWVQSKWVVPYEQAIEFYTEQIRRSPRAVTYNLRANVWSEKGERDIAIADYTEAIRLVPGDAIYWANRGDEWLLKQASDKAISDLNEAIRLDPRYVNAYIVRANAWRDKKEYDRAIADYNEAIRLDPKATNAYNYRAWIWATCSDEKFRDGKRAVESATRACELGGWQEADFIDTLAAAYAETGDFTKAVEWQEKANKSYVNAKDKRKGEERLKLFKDKKPYRDTE